jgi:F-type H+-transporting ATPase subunit b
MEQLLEISKSLQIDWTVVGAQSLSFLILLVLLLKFFYRPFEDILRQRQEQIANNLMSAEVQTRKAEALRQDYEAHLASIADEAHARMAQALKDADAARQLAHDAAQTEIRELYARHQTQLTLERDQLRRELRGEVTHIAIEAATKALRTHLTPEVQTAVVDQVIRELDRPVHH